jgi:hypothetical protein
MELSMTNAKEGRQGDIKGDVKGVRKEDETIDHS